MKTTYILVAVLVGLILCAVGYSNSAYHTSVGRPAPMFVVSNGQGSVTPASLRGRYTLLNFWSTADAPSRRRANLYTAWTRSHAEAPVELVSVNMDDNRELYREIVRADSLEAAQQFYASGDTAKAIRNNYGLYEGYGTVLIDPEGIIVAHNPDFETLNYYASL